MKKFALFLTLLSMVLILLLGGRYYLGQQMTHDFSQGYYAKSLSTYNRFGPYLSASYNNQLKSSLQEYLETTDDVNTVKALCQDLHLIDEPNLMNNLLPLEDQQQIFTSLDVSHRTEIFILLYEAIEAHPHLSITTTATTFLNEQSPVNIHTSGIHVDDDDYGTVLYALESSQKCFVQLDSESFSEYTSPMITTPDHNELHYFTTNRYGIDSTITTVSLDQKPFKHLIRLHRSLTNHGFDFWYKYAAMNPLSNQKTAIFFYDEVYLIANEPYDWSLDRPNSALTFTGIISDYEGFVPIDNLTLNDREHYQTIFNQILMALDTEETFYITSITPPLPEPFTITTDFSTWRSFKTAAENLLPTSEDTYLHNNMLVGRISKETPILYVKIFDTDADYKKGIRIVFGEQYANIYRFTQEVLVINNPLLVPTHYEETPIYSTHLDRSPFEYFEKISALAATFANPNETTRQIVESVGDYIVQLIDYDRKHILKYDSHTPYKALDEGLGVCESYAGLAHDILNELNIETYLIHADDENDQDDTHVYNLVNLGDRYAFYDFTWADKQGWIDKRYYGFDLGFHPYKPYVSQIVLDAFNLR